MPPIPTNADIMRVLGSIEADVKHGSESRKVLHAKLDTQDGVLDSVATRLSELAFTLQVTTDVAVQARDHIAQFERDFHDTQVPVIQSAAAFKAEAEPILKMMRTIRNIVIALFGLGILSVGSLLALAAYAGEILRLAIRSYLGIGV